MFENSYVNFDFFSDWIDRLHLLVWLALTLLLAEASEKLSVIPLTVVMSFSLLSVSTFILFGGASSPIILFVVLYMVVMISGIIYYNIRHHQYEDLSAQYEELYGEYRSLRRRITDHEETVRQEERHMIGQEIHDSVGHKLTSIIMQTEALRLTSGTEEIQQIEQLKTLANESLDETRKAVKTFKQKEIGGLQGVMRLIRKLEMESFLQIHFSVKHGAFAAPLTGEQSFVIYRCVQEGLTNIMKHSQAREAQITFDSPGGSIFRFEIVNPIHSNQPFKMGYGLTSMQERLEKVGGGVEAQKGDQQFVLRAWIRLNERGELNDKHPVG
ncbi:sensor histidine kinase [Alkalibacillus haloalkaliphilus]|uniref:sensor histidine kinase n=1 Tax=Alkalibacillus haloalkaliphilus TaxID=94136 RepID=UPI0002F6D3B4|nr:sensor histidine kinase [Alkalibacillus haloalkaliphilus]